MISPRGMLALAIVVGAAALGAAGRPMAAEARAAAGAAPHPDIGGTWTPDTGDQKRQVTGNVPPWNARVAAQADRLAAEESAGRPFPVLQGCLPHGMPSLMLIMHNAFEVLETPGRITFLGEGEGNNLRRIYTDGRKHPADPDPSLFGHSIGRWEGDTLVVDTVGVAPEAFVAISEGVGIPNDGDMHIVERFHLAGPDTLHDDLTITAPKILTKPWTTTRIYSRQAYDILEGECVLGNFREGRDKDGNAIYVPRPLNADGTVRLAQ
jgi:hypothetical protein